MLVLKRKEGQWVEIQHRSGDLLRLRVYEIYGGAPGRVNLAFEDQPRHFEIRRPERRGGGSSEETSPVLVAEVVEGATSIVEVSTLEAAVS